MKKRLLALGLALLTLSFASCATSNESAYLGKSRVKVVRKGDVINVRTTAYTHTESDHRKYGRRNALGTTLKSGGITSAAADWSRFPVGTKFKVVETGKIYEVDDYGAALVGSNTIDLYTPTKHAMNEWGVRRVDIKIIQVGSHEKSRLVLSKRTGYKHIAKMVKSMDSLAQLHAQTSKHQRLVVASASSGVPKKGLSGPKKLH